MYPEARPNHSEQSAAQITPYSQARDILSSLLRQSFLDEEEGHADYTLKWLLVLNPDADEILQLAAQFHDIERSQPQRLQRDQFPSIEEYKDAHANRGAEIASRIAERSGFTGHQIERLYELIAQHESGGSNDVGLIMDADSLSFFEYNLPFYISRNSSETTAEKVHFMFVRMSDRAQQLVRILAQNNEALSKVLSIDI